MQYRPSWLVWIFFFACLLTSSAVAAEVDDRFPLDVNGQILSKPQFHALLVQNAERISALQITLVASGFQPAFTDLHLTERTTQDELKHIARQAVALDRLLTFQLSFDNSRIQARELIEGLEAQRHGQYWKISRLIGRVKVELARPAAPAAVLPAPPPLSATPPIADSTPADKSRDEPPAATAPDMVWKIGLVTSTLMLLIIFYLTASLQKSRRMYHGLLERKDRLLEKIQLLRDHRDRLIDELRIRNNLDNPQNFQEYEQRQAARLVALNDELSALRAANATQKTEFEALQSLVAAMGQQLMQLHPIASFSPLVSQADAFGQLERPLQAALETLIQCLADREIDEERKLKLAPLSQVRVTIHDDRPKRQNLLWVTMSNLGRRRLAFADQ